MTGSDYSWIPGNSDSDGTDIPDSNNEGSSNSDNEVNFRVRFIGLYKCLKNAFYSNEKLRFFKLAQVLTTLV